MHFAVLTLLPGQRSCDPPWINILLKKKKIPLFSFFLSLLKGGERDREQGRVGKRPSAAAFALRELGLCDIKLAERREPCSANGALGAGRGLRARASERRAFFVFLRERLSRSGVR